MFNLREENAIYELNLLDGFWSPDDYYGFLNTFKYAKEQVLLDKYTIVERDRTRQLFNWLQCFEPYEVKGELQSCGLEVVEIWGDVSGKDYDPEADEFAVVARSFKGKWSASNFACSWRFWLSRRLQSTHRASLCSHL